jgi:N utilization substance protein A
MKSDNQDTAYEMLWEKAGTIVTGTVGRPNREGFTVNIDGLEICLPNRECVHGQSHNYGDVIKAYLLVAQGNDKEPRMILSRSHPNFIRCLIKAEIPEIASDTIEIRAVAREAGFRTKVAVFTATKGIEPVKVCIGPNAEHLQNLKKEIGNERIDFVRWSENPQVYAQRALRYYDFSSVTIDMENKTIYVGVQKTDLNKVIGKKGQNIRLATRLTGWNLKASAQERPNPE